MKSFKNGSNGFNYILYVDRKEHLLLIKKSTYLQKCAYGRKFSKFCIVKYRCHKLMRNVQKDNLVSICDYDTIFDYYRAMLHLVDSHKNTNFGD